MFGDLEFGMRDSIWDSPITDCMSGCSNSGANDLYVIVKCMDVIGPYHVMH